MAWGVDDLRKFVEGLANTFEGGTGMPMQVGNQNVQDAIVKPGKLLSDFSGVTQGIKGVDPKASNMDRGLALLTLAGMLGGQEAAMGLKGVAGKINPKVTMYHGGPVSGLSKLKPGKRAEQYVGPTKKGYTYLMDEEHVVGNLPQYLTPNHRVPMDGILNGSVYQVQVPLRKLESYTTKAGVTHSYGKRTSKALKPVKELKFSDKQMWEVKNVLKKFLNRPDD